MNKKLSTGLKSLFIIIIAVIVISLFGLGSITKFVFKKLLFTPYNIVGIIMTISTICGGYINKRQGHWIKLTLTIISGIISLFSLVCTICSWFNIDLLHIIWTKALRPTVISVGTVFLWILIVAIGIAVVGFVIYGLVKLICYIKDEKDWQEGQKIYNSQKVMVEKIAKENSIQNTDSKSLSQKNQQNVSKIPEIKEVLPNFIDKNEAQQKQDIKQVILPNDFELKVSNNICPECGWFLKKRINSQTGEQFRGCTNFAYHNCLFTISDDEYIRIYKKYH